MTRFAHISDLHLGLEMYDDTTIEFDVYDAFDQVIDKIIEEKDIDFVIMTGDLFHQPVPSTRAISEMGVGLKMLKKAGIPVYYIQGDHDISNMGKYPAMKIFEHLDLARHVGRGDIVMRDGKTKMYGAAFHKDTLIMGIDKIRKKDQLIQALKDVGEDVQCKPAEDRILMLHQGIEEVDKFAGEISLKDIPDGFDYYACGHLHEHSITDGPSGRPLVYPGSIERTGSEPIKNDMEKGFYIVEMNKKQPAMIKWIPIKTRRKMRIETDYEDLEEALKIIDGKERPVVQVVIRYDTKVPTDIKQKMDMVRDKTTHISYKTKNIGKKPDMATVEKNMGTIDEQILKLAEEALGSKELADFAVNDLMPVLLKSKTKDALKLIMDRAGIKDIETG